MKINANDIRVGNVLEFNGKLWVVAKTQHVQPGKGGAFMQVEMKNLLEGTKAHERYRSSEQVERVFLEERTCQYLYEEQGAYIFMDQETYEQFQIEGDLLGDQKVYLQDGMLVKVSFYETTPISASLPDTVTLEITEAEPVVKGQTASASFKPAVLENGVRIMVPAHIESGMRVVVHTSDSSYVERAK